VDDTSNIVRLAALQDGRALLPPPSNPMAVAREYVEQHCRHDGGAVTLRYWRGGWWQWRTSYWAEIESRAVRGMLYAFTENAEYPGALGR
jgi:putative DNA primase/helicase